MEANIFLLQPSQSKKSSLDKAYVRHIASVLKTINEDEEDRWEIYSIIIQELIKDGKEAYLKEIKYRLSDGENPNEVMLDIIARESDNINNLIWFLKRRIEEYLEDDFYKKFYL